MATLTEPNGVERIPIIDTDVHTSVDPLGPVAASHMPKRLRDYIKFRGMPNAMKMTGDRPRQRPFAARTDSYSPAGGSPGSDPEFVGEQLLDRYQFSGAVMSDIPSIASGGRPYPDSLMLDWVAALNTARAETWFAADERWYGSITMAHEAVGAAKEIQRCKEMPGGFGDRWVQVMLAPDNEKPAGHEKYWDIYEACEHYDIPVGFHVLVSRAITGTGIPNYYFEEHTQFAGYNFPLVASLIFDGVFERFPKLKVALIELAWSWAVPFAWRMDQAYALLKGEIPQLQRKPSEYLREHFWFSTQPMEEPEQLEWFDDVYQLFEDTLGDRLMYSSDYPHWDFDEPSLIPTTLPVETRHKILGETASGLYGIPLRAGTGLAVELAGA